MRNLTNLHISIFAVFSFIVGFVEIGFSNPQQVDRTKAIPINNKTKIDTANNAGIAKGNLGTPGNMSYMTLRQFAAGEAKNADMLFINEAEQSGIFRYDPNDKSTAADNAMTLVYAQKRFKRVTDFITPEFFGAKRDGVADDATAIQKALDYASRNKGSKIVFSPGVYLVGATLKLKPTNGAPDFNYNIMLTGAGLGTTEIKGTKTIAGNLLEMTYGQTKFQGKNSRVIIRDISFSAVNADRCFYADFVSQLRLEDCRFNGGQQYTVQLGSDDPTQNYSTYVTRCYFGGWTTTGGLNKGTLVAKHFLFLAIEEMETDGGRIGVDLYNSAACIINNSKIEGCKYAGVRISGDLLGEHRITNNYIICYGGLDFNAQFDGTLHGILIQGNNSGSSANNIISNNVIKVGEPKDMTPVAKISKNSKLNYNPSNMITGKTSGATARILGINEETNSLSLQPISGTFVKGEAFTQAGTGGGAVLNELTPIQTYGIKLEGNSGSNVISGNQLTTQTTYGIHSISDGNTIIGNAIAGSTGVYLKGNNATLLSNSFWCVNEPAVAINKASGSNFTSIGNVIKRGTVVGITDANILNKPLEVPSVNFKNLPTSASGLPGGSLWLDKAAGNVLKVVP